MAAKSPVSILMERYGMEVEYDVHRDGSDHAPVFTCVARFRGNAAKGVDCNKKASRQKAAQALLDLLSGPTVPPIDIQKSKDEPSKLVKCSAVSAPPIPASPSISTKISTAERNAISILKEFEDKNINCKVDYDLDYRPIGDNNAQFHVKCTLSGKIDGKITEPLIGVGCGSRKQFAKINAAEIVVRMLTEGRHMVQPVNNDGESEGIEKGLGSTLEGFSGSLCRSLEQVEQSSKVTNHEELKLTDEVQGSFKKLCEKLEGTGKKVFVDTLSSGSDDVQIQTHTCILSIRAAHKTYFDFDPGDPSWHGHHASLEVAKDIAAQRALKQLDQKIVLDVDQK